MVIFNFVSRRRERRLDYDGSENFMAHILLGCGGTFSFDAIFGSEIVNL